MAQKAIVPLEKCPASLGPKAAGLGAMLGLGLAGPAGFVIANATSLTAAQLRKAVSLTFAEIMASYHTPTKQADIVTPKLKPIRKTGSEE